MNPDQTTDLREYVRILRSRKVEVLAAVVVVVAATMFLTFRQTPQYEGETRILVTAVLNPLNQTIFPRLAAPNLDTERELIQSQPVAGIVRERTQTAYSIDTLREHVRVDIVTDTDVLIIRYADPDPRTAADLTNAYAESYIQYRQDQTLDALEQSAGAVQDRISAVEEQVAALNAEIRTREPGADRDALMAQRDSLLARLGILQQELVDLQPGAALQQGAQVLQRADVPDTPVSPNKFRNAALALVVGLVLGTGFAFLRERLDDRVKTREELERRLDAPVIAAVPKIGGWRRAQDAQLIMRSDPKSPVSEAYRTLGTNIQYLASREPMKVIMITSALGNEGKSTTACNLAIALARAGKKVVLVSADLRRPRVHQFFGLSNDVGLSEVLSDSTPLSKAARDPLIPNLRVVVGGSIPQDPAALLGSARAAQFFESLRDVADFVLIDSPPVLAVADASIMAPLVDATIYVVDAERSSRSALRHARDQLENAGAKIVGAVYNNFDANQASSYSAYYYYYQYYGTKEDENGDRGKSLRRLRRGSPNALEQKSSGSGSPRALGRSSR